jgi:cytochrome c biogenesis protein CcmG, thiol:disulfide interchange protein DsbE
MKKAVGVVGIFAALIVFLAIGLTRNPREVPSPLIGKPAPAFELPLLRAPEKLFSSSEPMGSVWVLNVWASWCAPCREEHPLMVKLSRSGLAPVYGLNYKDKREDAIKWLARFGDPYRATFADPQGRVGFDYGVYGVPETYVIDKKGIIRYKRVGPVSAELLAQKIVPLLQELKRE